MIEDATPITPETVREPSPELEAAVRMAMRRRRPRLREATLGGVVLKTQPTGATPRPKAKGRTGQAAADFEALHPRVKSRVGGGQFAKKQGSQQQGQQPGGPKAKVPDKPGLKSTLSRLGFDMPDQKAAIAAFQKSRGLAATGELSVDTERAMRNASYAAANAEPAAPVKPIEKDIVEKNKAIQARLDAAGFVVNMNGIWDQQSAEALKVFQQRHRIPVVPAKVYEDGSVKLDDRTLHVLAVVKPTEAEDGGSRGSSRGAGGSSSAAASRGAAGAGAAGSGAMLGTDATGPVTGEDTYIRRGAGMGEGETEDARVVEVQEWLDSLGFDLGEGGTDGRFGPTTEAAIRAFQERNGLAVTGVVDTDTWFLLQQQGAKKNAPPGDTEVYLSGDQTRKATAQQGKAVQRENERLSREDRKRRRETVKRQDARRRERMAGEQVDRHVRSAAEQRQAARYKVKESAVREGLFGRGGGLLGRQRRDRLGKYADVPGVGDDEIRRRGYTQSGPFSPGQEVMYRDDYDALTRPRIVHRTTAYGVEVVGSAGPAGGIHEIQPGTGAYASLRGRPSPKRVEVGDVYNDVDGQDFEVTSIRGNDVHTRHANTGRLRVFSKSYLENSLNTPGMSGSLQKGSDRSRGKGVDDTRATTPEAVRATRRSANDSPESYRADFGIGGRESLGAQAARLDREDRLADEEAERLSAIRRSEAEAGFYERELEVTPNRLKRMFSTRPADARASLFTKSGRPWGEVGVGEPTLRRKKKREDLFEQEDVIQERDFSAAERKKAAAEGAALPDGSFPIYTAEDLKNAQHLVGKAKDPAKAQAHIKKRAAALGISLKEQGMEPMEARVERDLEEAPRARGGGIPGFEALHPRNRRTGEWRDKPGAGDDAPKGFVARSHPRSLPPRLRSAPGIGGKFELSAAQREQEDIRRSGSELGHARQNPAERDRGRTLGSPMPKASEVLAPLGVIGQGSPLADGTRIGSMNHDRLRVGDVLKPVNPDADPFGWRKGARAESFRVTGVTPHGVKVGPGGNDWVAWSELPQYTKQSASPGARLPRAPATPTPEQEAVAARRAQAARQPRPPTGRNPDLALANDDTIKMLVSTGNANEAVQAEARARGLAPPPKVTEREQMIMDAGRMAAEVSDVSTLDAQLAKLTPEERELFAAEREKARRAGVRPLPRVRWGVTDAEAG